MDSHNAIQVPLPTVNTYCDACKSSPPFNAVPSESTCLLGQGQNHSFYLSYQCQQCKGPPVRFMVRREGNKLRLVGRDPIEAIPVSNVLPDAVRKYFGSAQIAHHAGQTLAGIFLLRVFIEQFWRTLPAVQELIQRQPRATGDEQGTVYQTSLPTDFRDRFPSLSDVYGQLSAAMHAANADAALFEDACAKVVEHFEARRLFKIPTT